MMNFTHQQQYPPRYYVHHVAQQQLHQSYLYYTNVPLIQQPVPAIRIQQLPPPPQQQQVFMIQQPQLQNQQQSSTRIFPKNPSSDLQVTEFLERATMTTHDADDRKEMIEGLQKVLSFGRVHLFGSFLTGIGDRESDVDIYFEDYEKRKKSDVMKLVLNAISGKSDGQNEKKEEDAISDSNSSDSTTTATSRSSSTSSSSSNSSSSSEEEGNKAFGIITRTLTKTRIPLVTFEYTTKRNTKVQCDVSFENIMSVQNTKLLKFYMELEPVTGPLIILLRKWADFHNLIDKRFGFKKYTISLLVIVYLVKRGFLPSVERLQKLVPPQFVDRKWNVAFCDDLDLVRKAMKAKKIGRTDSSVPYHPGSILPMAVDFFNMLKSILDHDIVVVTNIVDFIPVSGFYPRAYQTLSADQQSFVKSLSAETIQSLLHRGRLVVQDPFDLSFNVTNGCDYNFCVRLVNAMQQTIGHIYSSGPMNPIQITNFLPRLPPHPTVPKTSGDSKYQEK